MRWSMNGENQGLCWLSQLLQVTIRSYKCNNILFMSSIFTSKSLIGRSRMIIEQLWFFLVKYYILNKWL